MSIVVLDVDRPDVEGTPPKMQCLLEVAKTLEGLVPVLAISTDDNLGSSLTITGSFDERSDWAGGIFENSRYFRFMVWPPKDAKYYDPNNPKVTVELVGKSYQIQPNFRKGTNTMEKVVERIRKWIVEIN